MEDRSVQYPQRYQLKKVEGTDDIYDLIPAPGEITEEGTLINKSALLKDETAALFKDLPENPVPDDVLKVLSNAALVGEDGLLKKPNGDEIKQIEFISGEYTGNGKSGNGAPTTIQFGFKPHLVFIEGPAGNSKTKFGTFFIPSLASTFKNYSYVLSLISNELVGYNEYAKFDDTSNTLSFYSSYSSADDKILRQLNANGVLYKYVAIGYKEGL